MRRRVRGVVLAGQGRADHGCPSESQIVRAARILGGSRSSAMILTARGAEQQAQGVNNTLSYINIALALGLVGKPNSGYGCLTGQGNGQGGREHGQKSDQLPGYRLLTDPAARRHVSGGMGSSGVRRCRCLVRPRMSCWTRWVRTAVFAR